MVVPAAYASSQGAKAGQQAWQAISSALAADLVVIRTQTTLGRGKKKKPVDLEFHVNPLGLGTAAVGAGLALWLMQLRLAPTTTPDGKQKMSIQSRSGFLGNGAGTETSDLPWYISPIGWFYGQVKA